jgi:hypothetical protein
MTIQTINLGNYANDGTGDDLRTAFNKVNQNFASLTSGLVAVTSGANVGTGTGIYKDTNLTTLEFKKLNSANNSVIIVDQGDTIDLASSSALHTDPAPYLNADLDIQGHRIIDTLHTGDIQTTVYGINVPNLSAIFGLVFAANKLSIDFSITGNMVATGSANPAVDTKGINLDCAGINFADALLANPLDFGTFV